MFFVFFFAWIIFNGKFTLELALFGVFFSVVLTWFMVKYLDYQIQNEIKIIKKIPLFLQLLAVLVLEIAKANEQLLYWIFSEFPWCENLCV